MLHHFFLFLVCLSITNSRANKREHCYPDSRKCWIYRSGQVMVVGPAGDQTGKPTEMQRGKSAVPRKERNCVDTPRGRAPPKKGMIRLRRWAAKLGNHVTYDVPRMSAAPPPPSWSRTVQASACRAGSGGRDWPALGPAVWRRSVTASATCMPSQGLGFAILGADEWRWVRVQCGAGCRK